MTERSHSRLKPIWLEQALDSKKGAKKSLALSQYLVIGLAWVAAVLGGFIGGTLSSDNSSLSLHAEDAELLNWAKSEQGQLAHFLVKWNTEYLQYRQCQDDISDLGIELVVGDRVASSGFCALWVVRPEEREFKQ